MTYTITRDSADRDLKALRELLDPNRLWVPSEDSMTVLHEIRAALEEQVRPAIEEPQEFGSIVRAGFPYQPVGSERFLWQHAPMQGKHYWESETGAVEVWSELTDVEVLRIGVGELPSESQKAAQDDAYVLGYEDGRNSKDEAARDASEPTEFGSVVRKVFRDGSEQFWCRTYRVLVDRPWCTGNHTGSWSDVIEDAADVEVLRVGLGNEKPLTASDLSRMGIEANAATINAERDAYENGARDLAAQIHKRLLNMLEDAITSERKNALEKAIQAVEELAP